MGMSFFYVHGAERYILLTQSASVPRVREKFSPTRFTKYPAKCVGIHGYALQPRVLSDYC